MQFKSLLLGGALVIASALAGTAATYNLGDVTGGATISNTLTKQTVDFVNFSLDAPGGFALSSLDISVKSTAKSNFTESIALYFGSALVAKAVAVQGGGNGVALSFSGPTMLAAGNYTLGIAGWKAFFTPDVKGAYSTAFFNNGKYSVNIETSLAAVPVPAGGLLLLSGLGMLAFARRKTRRA
ncbi:MAG: VPLPA-CTERM sorting domain-containing protein [Paracoccaceae bacterium]